MSRREAVLATVTALLDETLVRVGNEEYARANASFGLTTLRNRHVKIGRGAVRLVFTGKSGLPHDVTLRDRRLVRAVRNCHQLPGQLLFQYEEDDGGELHAVHSNDVNDYLRDAAGLDVTAKQFRTWRATVLAASELGPRAAPTRRTAANRITRSVVEFVAERLGNTPAVCRASYIHPGVVAAFEAGDLARWWEGAAPRRGGRLYADERRLLVVLRRLRRGERRGSSRRPDTDSPSGASTGVVSPFSAQSPGKSVRTRTSLSAENARSWLQPRSAVRAR